LAKVEKLELLLVWVQDIVEWEEDGDEYLQKNLPKDVLQVNIIVF
jgi:hypothetical protein